MNRTLGCLALGAALGLIAAAWPSPTVKPAVSNAATRAARPKRDCCSGADSAREDWLGPARAALKIDDEPGGH